MHVRLLNQHDRDAVLRLCAKDEVSSLFVASRVGRRGVERYQLGCDLLGGFDGGELVSLVHVGANIVPVGVTDAMVPFFVPKLGPYRYSNSFMGPSRSVLALFTQLSQRYPRAFGRPRDIRARQPLMVISGPPTVAPDPRVRLITEDSYDAYFEAAVQMYQEEVGVSPLSGDDSYALHVMRLIKDRRAIGIRERGRIIFKSDIGTAHEATCQIQGVWLDPSRRGRGESTAAMAAVVDVAREQFGTVTLYVNDYNAPALALYRRVGFAQVGEFATVLY